MTTRQSYRQLQDDRYGGDVDDSIDFKATEKCCLKSWQRYLMIGAIIALLLLIIGLVIGLVLTIVHSATPTPTFSCPLSPPSPALSCNHSTEEACLQAECCWYGNNTCLYELSCHSDANSRFDCLPENDNWNSSWARDMCLSRGCCWNEGAGPVSCSYPQNYGYKLEGRVQDTPSGASAFIVRKDNFPLMYGADVNRLKIDVTYETSYRIRVKIYDPAQFRYEVPLNLTSPLTGSERDSSNSRMYSFSVTEDESFGFELQRLAPARRTLFKTAPGLVASEQFLQLSAHINSSYVYGLGEHATPWRLDMNHSKLTLFVRDVPPDPVFDPTRNLYGVHPFYLSMEDDGSAHGVFLLNSNAMEIELLPYPAITYRTIGGILDFYYFLGPSPSDVISQYTELIGRPFLPPYWSLGFHLCRWGYFSSNRTLEIVQRMRKHGIPQDTQWNDIDYMSQHLDFTYNHTTYGTMPELVENLHNHGQHYVIITDPGISATQPAGAYPPFDDGVTKGIFILNSTGQPLLGKVWPGITAYPDFTNPQTQDYWLEQMSHFHDNISFDGLWIDMNEPSNFIPGSVNGCPDSTLNSPPFLPVAIRRQGSAGIESKTLCMTGRQYVSSHYNVHSLYGHTEAIETMNALQLLLKERSLVISRSTYPGSGTHCGHWLGDNASQWPHIRQSIPGILNFALFGIPLVGADICGFFDNTTNQLCTRWQQVGAFYPFSRNHNTYNANPQDPTEFTEESIASTREILLIRYKLLPFLYTLFYYAHINGSMVATPLLSVFPADKETWTNGYQFMWGKALLISPVLEENATQVTGYFPEGKWFDYRNGTELNSNGQYVVLSAPLNYIPLHVLGGHIIPQQEPNTTTTQSRQNPYSLLVALDSDGKGQGSLFLDNGTEIDSIANGHYSLLSFQAESGRLSSTVINGGYSDAINSTMDRITVYGIPQSPVTVSLNGNVLNTWIWNNNVLDVDVEITNLNNPFSLEWNG